MAPLNELPGFRDLQIPLIQAPMAGSNGSALALEVCKAGALGSVPAAMLTPEQLQAELEKMQASGKPYNVNFFVHKQPAPDAEREQKWRDLLTPFYNEAGIDASAIPSGGGRNPFSEEMCVVLEKFKPAVVSFHFGLPEASLLTRVKAMGSAVLSSATTVDEAIWLEANGADVIIAQGLEAGGHRGHFLDMDLTRQMGTFALLPQIVTAVKVPVIAAGGIADAPSVEAAMTLGASGVQVGTRFLLCPESLISAIHRQALLSPEAQHTALTRLFSGRPARGIMNRVMRELGPLNEAAPEFPLAGTAMLPLRAWAEKQGKGDFTSLWSGQHVVPKELPAAEVVKELAEAFKAK